MQKLEKLVPKLIRFIEEHDLINEVVSLIIQEDKPELTLSQEIVQDIYDCLIKLDNINTDRIMIFKQHYDLHVTKERTKEVDNIRILISPCLGKKEE